MTIAPEQVSDVLDALADLPLDDRIRILGVAATMLLDETDDPARATLNFVKTMINGFFIKREEWTRSPA